MKWIAIAAAAMLGWSVTGASPAVADTEDDLERYALSPVILDLAASPLERGLASFQAGQFAAAIAPLSAAYAAEPSDLDTGLLLGISYLRCDDAARARP